MKFLNLFRTKPAKKIDEIVQKEAEASTIRKSIASTIINNAADFGIPIRPQISVAENPEKHTRYIYGYYEYVYFQLYHFKRAVSKFNQKKDAVELEHNIFQIVPESIINGFWPNVPSALMKKMVAEFGRNMGMAFTDYDKCYRDPDPGKGFEASVKNLEESVFSAFRVSVYPEEEIKMISHILDVFSKLDIENLVARSLRGIN